MNLKKRFNIFLIVFVTTILLPTIIIIILNFRNYSITTAKDKASIVANMVKDGLTTHMENGIMDKREIFLSKIKNVDNVKDLKILRSKSVDKQFGKSVESSIKMDSLEKEVLEKGIKKEKLIETKDSAFLKIVIPYKATAFEIPNCLKCHDAKEGEVLGAISMEFDITDVRNSSLITISKIVLFSLIITIIGLFIVNIYTKKYVDFFEDLKNIIKKAFNGDYSNRLKSFGNNELSEISRWINALFDKIENSLENIKRSVGYFINFELEKKDPLLSIQDFVNELAAIYKFKNIIERDKDLHQIYDRMIELLERKFEIKNFVFYELDKSASKRNIYYSNTQFRICDEADEDISLCRAYRTQNIVSSDKYLHICEAAKDSDLFYVCIPLKITDEFFIVLSFIAESKEEFKRVKSILDKFKNYLEVSKSAIETQILLDELKDLSLKDKMTGAYNRRYLDIFVQKNIPQALRANTPYSILMVDIDYFKMVNDTYGHDAGDTVIKELVKTIFENIRESDVVVRFGGEEFLILLYNCTKENAKIVAEKIKTKFKNKFINVGMDRIKKTISIGIAEFPKDSSQFWQTIKFADMALYKAKESGRDRIITYNAESFKIDENY